MKILFLGGNSSKELFDWLKSKGEDVVYTEDRIDIDFMQSINPSFIISYNYRFLISKEILDYVERRAINLHISYLPWNKGAYPNVWSFLDNTPKGVTIHYIDEGIDSGDIIIQKETYIDESNDTLATSYMKLHDDILSLFKENWECIRFGQLPSKKQKDKGSIHYLKDYSTFEPFIREKGWDTPIKELKQKYELWKSNGTFSANSNIYN